MKRKSKKFLALLVILVLLGWNEEGIAWYGM